MTVVPFPAGQGQGTVAARTRKNSGDGSGAADRKSSAPDRLMTFQAVADHCAVSIWTVRAWADSGKLAVLRLPGRLVRVHPAELERFLEACR